MLSIKNQANSSERPKKAETTWGKGTLVEFEGISYFTPEKVLFYDLNLRLSSGDKVALVGKSGVGKTTLLSLLLGSGQQDEGKIDIQSNTSISYVPQEISELDIEKDTTVRQLFYKTRGLDLIEIEKEKYEKAIEGGDTNPITLEKYAATLEKFESLGGYVTDGEISKILSGLKLDEKSTGHINFFTTLKEVSSGQLTRLLIGQALFSESNLLVLDDPTSHLDIDSVSWLASFLRVTKRAFIISTNNVNFIDSCCNRIIEITDFGRTLSFRGSYTEYSLKRDLLLSAEKSAAENAKKKIDQLRATYAMFKSKNAFARSVDMAQVGRALVTRIDRLEDQYNHLPGSQKVFRNEKVRPLVFESETRSGNDILRLENIEKSYGSFVALKLPKIILEIHRGDILRISGENGSGKSTLLRMIAHTIFGGDFLPNSGKIHVGANIKAAYYSPSEPGLPKEGTLFEALKKSIESKYEIEVTSILKFFGFSGSTIRSKKIEQLSAGEKKQFALARLMGLHPNLLLLDEPTDNLKEELIKRLSDAIKGFDGTTILISHNSEFVNMLPISRELKLPSGDIVINKK